MEEIWKKHPLIDDRYEFSNLGKFRNTYSNQLLKPTFDKFSRGVVTFLKVKDSKVRKRVRLARLIADIFIPNSNPLNNIIIHKDENPLNNSIDNLKWGTTKETIDIAFNNGNRVSPWKVITDDDVRSIRKEFDETMLTMGQLAVKYNTTPGNIASIVKYISRELVDPHKPYKFVNLSISDRIDLIKRKETHKSRFIDKDTFDKILLDYVNTTMKLSEISEKYKVSFSAIKYNLKITTLPSIKLFDGEVFKSVLPSIMVSNYGRLIENGRLSNFTRLIINNKSKVIRQIVAEQFVPNPNNFVDVVSIDGNIKNTHYTNLKWDLPNKAKTIFKDGRPRMTINQIVKAHRLSEIYDY